jgi:hypothetical protein
MYIVCDPDKQIVEGRATGFLYTMLSRATTYGDEDGLHSAIYFIGSDLTRDRIQKLTLKSNTNVTLVNVARRSAWVSHLENNVVDVSDITDEMLAELVEWAEEKVDYEVLYNRCKEYEAIGSTAFSRETLHIS